MNYTDLSRMISHALRHEPWLYELELDDKGWVCINELLSALQTEKKEWANLTEDDLAAMIQESAKKRHELKTGKIRALYGHSTPQKLLKEPAEPPEILYHGTSPEIAEIIFKEGIKPMNRHYVHLSVDTETAKQVAYRKSKKPLILTIKAKDAYKNNVQFYVGNELVWLADYVPNHYIDIID